MIKNVVFDMGNVLINYKPEAFIQSFTSNEKHQQMLLNEIFILTYGNGMTGVRFQKMKSLRKPQLTCQKHYILPYRKSWIHGTKK